ncbi:MAG: WhiB family transcriptional regulator [Ferrimicrobium acidiphilum]
MTIHTIQENTTWRAKAACHNTKLAPNAWFPVESELEPRNYQAIEVCENCPVATECFDEGIALGEWYTIRGGIPGPERHEMSRF